MMEEGPSTPPPVNIRSVVEIVGVFGEADKTRSQDVLRVQYADSGLPDTQWRAAADDEINWIDTGKTGERLKFYESQRILYPHRCVIIGASERYAFAMHCTDTTATTATGATEVTLEELQAANTLSDRMELCIRHEKALARNNNNMAFKMLLMGMETQTFRDWMQKVIGAQKTPEYMRAFLSRVMDIATVDANLRTVIKSLGKSMTERMQALTKKQDNDDTDDVDDTKTPVTEERPGGAFATISFATDTHMLLPERLEPTDTSTSLYTLMACKLPAPGAKPQQWKELAIEVRTRNNSAPTVAYNDEYCVVVYQPCQKRMPAVAEVYQCASDNVRKWSLKSRIPLAFHAKWFDATRSGLIYADLSAKDTIIAIAFSNAIMVFDVLGKRYDQCMRIIQVRDGRLVTCVRVSDTGRDVAFGTSAGEAYVVRDWDQKDATQIVAAECTHFVEHVWDVHWRPEAQMLLMQTVMSVAGHVTSTDVITELPNVRPVAMERYGGLVFVLSKYGVLTVREVNTGDMWREMEPPVRPKYAQSCPLLQPFYKGCRVLTGGKGLICIYPDGLVRLVKRATVECSGADTSKK